MLGSKRMVGITLGLPGQWAEDELESSDHYTTKIGGLPDWPPLPDDALKSELLNCSSCATRLSLIAQVYAPISIENSEIEDRTLYIFGCLMLKCGISDQSWRAIRVQKVHKEKESDVPMASPLVSVSKTHYLDDSDSEEDIDLASLAMAVSEAATVASNSKKQNKKQSSKESSDMKLKSRAEMETGAVIPCFYVYTQEEKPSKDIENRLLMNYSSLSIKEQETDEHGSEEKWEDESYEYDKALNADRTYLKFKKCLDANPEQCFRYSYGSKPLLATGDLKTPRKCGFCGSPRLYELQLMPPVIYFLHEAVTDTGLKQLLDSWDWMTLIVYTCSKSCTSAVNGDWIVAEECISVQYDKPMNLDHTSFFK